MEEEKSPTCHIRKKSGINVGIFRKGIPYQDDEAKSEAETTQNFSVCFRPTVFNVKTPADNILNGQKSDVLWDLKYISFYVAVYLLFLGFPGFMRCSKFACIALFLLPGIEFVVICSFYLIAGVV